MLRWGVIGAGGFADRRAIPGLCRSRNGRLQAVMVRAFERAEALARKHGAVAAYDTVDALLADTDVDAVYVCTPVHLHREHVVRSARAGKHVLCEKPLARTAAEAEEMASVCAENGRLLLPGFMFRFHTSHLKIKKLIGEGALGQIVSARAQLHLWYPDTPGAWRQQRETGGGGCLMDVGSHCLDLLCYLLGNVSAVAAMMDTVAFDYEVEDICHLLLKFECGAQASVDTAFSIPNRENPLEIYGVRGTLLARRTIGPFDDPSVTLVTESGEEGVTEELHNSYTAEFEHFADCVTGERTPIVTTQDGIDNMRLIEAAYAAADSGRAVTLPSTGDT